MSVTVLGTQLLQARRGELSVAMRTVAEAEGLRPDFIRDRVAAGRLVIPANHEHRSLVPIGIGSDLRTKVNANLGNSALSSDIAAECEKLDAALRCGADAVMDLSTGADIDRIRRAIIGRSPAPVGTVPIYEAMAAVETAAELTPELLLATIAKQAEQGVDFMTLHAGILRAHVPLAKRRLLGIVSRGGALLAQWMQAHEQENPLYTRFAEILEICVAHDVTLSLGDALRPGCLADASDDAQFAELDVLGELVGRSRAAGVQAMVEGPGHIPIDQIEMNMVREAEVCDGAPFYILGPVVADCAPGYDHITSAIGAALGAFHGAAMLCYVTPKEHLGLPNRRDVRDGVMAYRIAAHAADIARGKPGARDRDDAMSRARADFDWERQFELALDPDKARELRREALAEQAVRAAGPGACSEAASGVTDGDEFCTMCGPKFCSMRLSRDLKAQDS